ncbi:MAG: D-tyrosyl-tRNA(Tyr) deacylase, partial [Verrucomicrobia bacterium]
MRLVVQRVRSAAVDIAGNRHAAIGPGLLVLVGIEPADTTEDLEWLAAKTANLRVFDDEA